MGDYETDLPLWSGHRAGLGPNIATVLIAAVLGFGAGWSYRGDLLTFAGLSAGANSERR
jgi:hypothetical protein